VVRLENVTNVGRICVKILEIDMKILRNTRENTVRNLESNNTINVRILGNTEVTVAMTSEIVEVISVKNLRSDTKIAVEKLGSTVRTLGIDARMPRDIKAWSKKPRTGTRSSRKRAWRWPKIEKN
jgi:hypothetical protein